MSVIISHDKLKDFVLQVFTKMEVPAKDVLLAASVLLSADLRGIDSHGVARLPGYVRLWRKKRINANPDFKIVHEMPSTATVDGDAGLGLVIGPKAMAIAIEKARIYGTGWVAVRNSNHFGIGAFHAMMALEHDMIGVAMTNASPLVAPTFSIERMLGTNPICYAFPSGNEDPVVVDMATSAAANGKLELAQFQDKQIPEGWVQDKTGGSSTDPHILKAGGSLLPLGSDRDHGSHKGFGLAATVDILSGVLSGANYGPWVPPFVAFLEPPTNPVGLGIGHFFGAMKIDAFRPTLDFKNNMDFWIRRFKEAKPAAGGPAVIIPGQPEAMAQKDRELNGIPLLPYVYDELTKLGSEMGINFK